MKYTITYSQEFTKVIEAATPDDALEVFDGDAERGEYTLVRVEDEKGNEV